jgi:hypothetical protein
MDIAKGLTISKKDYIQGWFGRLMPSRLKKLGYFSVTFRSSLKEGR